MSSTASDVGSNAHPDGHRGLEMSRCLYRQVVAVIDGVTLYDYQEDAVEFALARTGAALLMEQGTGKTVVTAGIIDRLMQPAFFEGLFTALLVVPLANVETTWMRMLERIDGLEIHRSWDDFRASKYAQRVLLVHYEKLNDKKLVKKLVKAQWSLVVYDESQRIKSRSSKASRAAARFQDVAHRVILTGTPIEQAPQDLWAQLRFAAPDALGTRWADFDAEWLTPCGYMGYERKFKQHLMPKFLERLKPYVLRVTKREVLDLPPMTFHREVVPLLGEQARVYREIKREMTTVLVGGEEIICDLAITQLVRLQQVAGGFIRTEGGESVVVGRAKERRLKRVLEREEMPLIVFCKYREELEACERVARSLGVRFDFIRGAKGKSGKHRRVETVERFQRGEIDVLICQIRAGGVGLDLYRACVAVFYSTTFSSIDVDQAISRIHRHGQTRAVRIITIEAQDTVDTTIRSDLHVKRQVSEAVLDDHRSHRRFQMAKDKSEKNKEKAKDEGGEKKKPTPPPQPPKPKYGVTELAEALKVKPTSVRVRLRNAGIEKNGKVYGWETKAEMQAVIDKLKASSGRKKGDDGDDEEEEDEDE